MRVSAIFRMLGWSDEDRARIARRRRQLDRLKRAAKALGDEELAEKYAQRVARAIDDRKRARTVPGVAIRAYRDAVMPVLEGMARKAEKYTADRKKGPVIRDADDPRREKLEKLLKDPGERAFPSRTAFADYVAEKAGYTDAAHVATLIRRKNGPAPKRAKRARSTV